MISKLALLNCIGGLLRTVVPPHPGSLLFGQIQHLVAGRPASKDRSPIPKLVYCLLSRRSLGFFAFVGVIVGAKMLRHVEFVHSKGAQPGTQPVVQYMEFVCVKLHQTPSCHIRIVQGQSEDVDDAYAPKQRK